jgi:hypothetical protein
MQEYSLEFRLHVTIHVLGSTSYRILIVFSALSYCLVDLPRYMCYVTISRPVSVEQLPRNRVGIWLKENHRSHSGRGDHATKGMRRPCSSVLVTLKRYNFGLLIFWGSCDVAPWEDGKSADMWISGPLSVVQTSMLSNICPQLEQSGPWSI